ncbi:MULTISPECIES: DUF1501 domain-containing protein [unclassified Arcicella]|uniref:DUF1501 domain-containing protein n=1 Tax=unclassified Arcicella TaxID=2644986 RepID=UPI002858572C|nr:MULTISPECIES: DUF1501 domain-containing protein [unclassified Arcicella]MDR6563957.1 uncharacterized protein (DUF1501 family) [Arcicella sp. BE51]MDR6813710.1 uncharacterized protein (DUF1501 family) [Arcicella sp. BE140]MDR6825022.1 uncharacterized protein (DUF1501 family) [Arcicella sp. BE139]
MVNRREFLTRSALATVGGLMIPNFLKAFEQQSLGSAKGAPDKILVIIQLSGGNDGLNTVVPYRNDIYYRERPTIAVERNKVLNLNDEIGLNPALEKLRPWYDNGFMRIINNVGYPNPDRSHFRSMDIWQTASNPNEYLQTGWLGRYLDANCSGDCASYNVLEIDDTLSLSMKGEKLKGLAVLDPEKLYRQVHGDFIAKIAKTQPADHSDNVSYLYKTLAETSSSAEYLHAKSKIYQTKATFPNGELGQRLKTISELILSGMPTNIYYVSISGFDTHVNQVNQQERLLRNYAETMDVFLNELKQNNKLDDVVMMTFSEFGRRVKQNASGGTDHGTANNVFLMGGKLKADKILNEAPNLTDLDEGDLKYSVDFRKIYATLLRNWLLVNDEEILGKRFDVLDFV